MCFQHILLYFLIGGFRLRAGAIQLVQVKIDLDMSAGFLLGQLNNRFDVARGNENDSRFLRLFIKSRSGITLITRIAFHDP